MQKEVKIFIIAVALILIIASLTTSAELNNFAPNELLIKYKSNIIIEDKEVIKELAEVNKIKQPESVKEILPNKNSGIYNLKFDDNTDIKKTIKEYESINEIEYAEPNYILTTFNLDPFINPDDTRYSDQWGLPNINAPLAWNLTTGNSSVSIAIIDTGVDWDHPDLLANIWNNTDEDCNVSSDLDGNGYNGDCRGYDFTDINTTWYVENGYTLDNNEDYNVTDNNPMDYHGHGTHCSGIAAAIGNNNEGVAGVCWNCSIMPVRAGFKIQHPSQGWVGSLETDDAVSAIIYATDNNATIISMSFGGSHSTTLQSAINDSYDNGTILVASAGNSGANSKQYPCAYDNVICVAATDSDNTSASYSNYGNWINLSAPGTGIWSTVYNDTYSSMQGTSMATPFIAGAIGLIKSAFPNKNQTEIETTLNKTGTNVDFSGFNTSRINIYSAILSLDNTTPNIALISPSDNHANLSLNHTFSCNATDWQLKNATLEIWNSSDEIYYNESKNISGIFNSTSFNVTNFDYDNYKWNCLICDHENNCNYADSNFTLTIGNITVSLITPVNNSNKNTNETNFNCSAQSQSNSDLTNITFSLWNSSSLIYNITKNISGNLNSSLFNYNFSREQTYHWNCQAYNNITQNSVGNSNYTFVYDYINPSISQINPNEGISYTSNSQSIIFEYNITETNDITNCSLIINGIPSLTNSSINKSTSNGLTKSFSPGHYNWNVNCTDKANNIGNSSLRSFTVNAPSSTTSSSGGGGGGGGSGGGSLIKTSKTYLISNQQISQGYTNKLSKNDKIQFVFFDKKTEKHTLTINDVHNDYVKLIIESNPIELKLGIGQSAKLNLTSPDYYNLFIKLNSIENKNINISIQLINEKIPYSEDKSKVDLKKENGSNPESLMTGEIIREEENKNVVQELRVLMSGLVILILVIIIFTLFKEKKYLKEKIKKLHLQDHKNKFNKHIRPKKKS